MITKVILQNPGRGEFLTEIMALLSDARVVRSYTLVAFATLSGVQLLGPDDGGTLFKFLDRGGEVDWIIGVDSVTTAEALTILWTLEQKFSNCRIRAYASVSGLFHPKLYLFELQDGSGVMLAGSNNLTAGGLVANTEFAVREVLSVADFSSRKQSFDAISSSIGVVQEIDAGLVKRVASRGMAIPSLLSPKAPLPVHVAPTDLIAATDGEATTRVLLREVPRLSTGRLSQLGTPKEFMEEFFGLVTKGNRIRIQQMLPGGELKPIEPPRQLIIGAGNRNRRFEVGALRGMRAPETGPLPVLIFQEIIPRDLYRYMLLMPGDGGHAETSSYLNDLPKKRNWRPSAIITMGNLIDLWPGYPH